MINYFNLSKNKGLSLIEIILTISIITVLSAIIIPSLSSFHNQQVLNNTTEDVVSLLNEARNNTISSKNSNTYGVHFQTDKVILFTGTIYSNLDTNIEVLFDSAALIPTTGGINLSGGGNDIVFDRITGDTINNGTIVIQQASDPTKQKVININTLGIIGIN